MTFWSQRRYNLIDSSSTTGINLKGRGLGGSWFQPRVVQRRLDPFGTNNQFYLHRRLPGRGYEYASQCCH